MAYHHQYGLPLASFRFSTIFEPSEFLNDAGLPKVLALSSAYDQYKTMKSSEPETRAMLDNLLAQWTGQDQLLLSRNPNGRPYREHFSDVRDIVRGLLLAIEKRGSRRRGIQPGRQHNHRLGRSCTPAGRTIRRPLRRRPPAHTSTLHPRYDQNPDPARLRTTTRSEQRNRDRRSLPPRRKNRRPPHRRPLPGKLNPRSPVPFTPQSNVQVSEMP